MLQEIAGIIVDIHLKEKIIDVIMVKMVSDKKYDTLLVLHSKRFWERYWNLMNESVQDLPIKESNVIWGYLNGHVEKTDGHKR